MQFVSNIQKVKLVAITRSYYFVGGGFELDHIKELTKDVKVFVVHRT